MFGNKSGAKSDLEYKINEVNVATNWNPNAKNASEMGGFNFSTENKILRWLIRGDTLYDVTLPKDAEIIDVENKSAPHGVFRTNKIVLKNPRVITDEMALELYRKSDLPHNSYFKSLAGCIIRGYRNTCKEIIKDKVNENNLEFCLEEIRDFIRPDKAEENKQLYNEILLLIKTEIDYKKEF